MTQRTILTPTNLFYRLKEMMNIIFDRVPDHQFSNREVWSQETENAFHNFQSLFRKDLEKMALVLEDDDQSIRLYQALDTLTK
jgi:hypothetical protein